MQFTVHNPSSINTLYAPSWFLVGGLSWYDLGIAPQLRIAKQQIKKAGKPGNLSGCATKNWFMSAASSSTEQYFQMNQSKQVLTTTGFICREHYVINTCWAHFQTGTSWQFPVTSFLTMNELQDNVLFCTGLLIVLLCFFLIFMLSLESKPSQYFSQNQLIDSEGVKRFSSAAAYWIIIRIRSGLPAQKRELTKRIHGWFLSNVKDTTWNSLKMKVKLFVFITRFNDKQLSSKVSLYAEDFKGDKFSTSS